MEKNISYRVTGSLNGKVLEMGFFGLLPLDLEGQKIRLQAVFAQKATDRRLPLELDINYEDVENHVQLVGVLNVELDHVFIGPPKSDIEVYFSLWHNSEEIELKSQSFRLKKDLFAGAEPVQKKKSLAFAGYTMALPAMLAKSYMKEGKNMDKAKKSVNAEVYKKTGKSYSPRQEHTDYFAKVYEQCVQKEKEPQRNRVLFLSERRPEEDGNLMCVKRMFEADPEVQVEEFISTTTIDALTKEEIAECAEQCARAAVIILEDFYPQLHALKIRKETRVVQLWHACGAFKTFGFSRMGKQGGVDQSSMNHRNYDLVCVSSEPVCKIYAEAFGVPTAKVLPLGVPRTDVMFDWQYKLRKRSAIYTRYPQFKDAKIVLFAPTFRGDGNKDAYYPADAFDIDAYMKQMPEDVKMIIKRHPFVKENPVIPEEWKDRVFDLSDAESLNELLLVADLLITDYSSSVFEAVLAEVPVVIYAFDEEEYIAGRDFYTSLKHVAPGPVAHTLAGLVKSSLRAIEQDANFLGRRAEAYRRAYLSMLDGQSTKRIYTYIKDNYLSAQVRRRRYRK